MSSDTPDGPKIPPYIAGALYRHGVTPERIPRLLAAFHLFRDMVQDGLPLRDSEGQPVSEEERREALEAADLCFEHVSRIAGWSALARRALEAAGYTWNPETRDAKLPSDGQGGRRSQYSVAVESAFETIARVHREEHGGPLPEHNCQDVRERIGDHLRALGYGEERCDPSYRGPVWTALDNYLSKYRHRG